MNALRRHRRANRTALRGGLGQFEAKYLMSLAMAHAGRLAKYGA
jgi:2,3-bisphosphoglycerate-independent phosphoglycerate mutase